MFWFNRNRGGAYTVREGDRARTGELVAPSAAAVRSAVGTRATIEEEGGIMTAAPESACSATCNGPTLRGDEAG